MKTSTNSTRNTSTKNANNQQRKSFSNNLVILTGNLGADAAFFGANDSAASFRMATKSKFGEKEYVEWHSVVAFRELAKESSGEMHQRPVYQGLWLPAQQRNRGWRCRAVQG